MARIKINPETVALLDMVEDRRSFILIRYFNSKSAKHQNVRTVPIKSNVDYSKVD